MLSIKLNTVVEDPAARVLRIDPVQEIDDLDDTIRHIFDNGFPYSYSGAANDTPPVNGSVIRDLCESYDGGFVLLAGQSVDYVGGGFDYSTLSQPGAYQTVPAAFSTEIWNSVAQHFMVVLYLKLPAQSDWTTSTTLTLPILQFSTPPLTYTADPALLMIGMSYGSTAGRRLHVRRQTALTPTPTSDQLVLYPTTSDFGRVAQVAYWRTDAGQFLRLKTSEGEQTATTAEGVNNTADFSGKTGRVGVPNSAWPSAFSGVMGANKFKVFRGIFANLEGATRDPVLLLDSDWRRVTDEDQREPMARLFA